MKKAITITIAVSLIISMLIPASFVIAYSQVNAPLQVNNFFFSNGDFNQLSVKTIEEIPSDLQQSTSPPLRTTSFISVWDTTKTSSGSSNSTQIKLPLESSGTYDFIVDWGDQINSHITVYNDPAVTHTYAEEGVYTVNITGIIIGWRFNNGGDRQKLLDIQQWGTLRLGNSNGYFYGCNNLAITATDLLDLTGTTTMRNAFGYCTSLTTVPRMNEWDVSQITDMYGMFLYASAFNQDISGWNTHNVVYMNAMFYSAYAFNQDIDGWNTSKVTRTSHMFCYASSFNLDISSWDTSNITNMYRMFRGATAFNQDLSSWDVISLEAGSTTGAAELFYGVTLSTENYDKLLIGWSTQPVQQGVYLDGGNSLYTSAPCPGGVARQTLVDDFNWVITDGGSVPCNLFPPEVLTNASTDITPTTATLNGYLLSDGNLPCTVRFEYGTTTAYGTNTTNQTKHTGETFNQDITSLTPGQLYHNRAYANNTMGSDTGEDQMFLTKPHSPTSMTATPLNSATISLSWTTGTGANHTRIQRKQGSYPLTFNDGTNVYNGTGTTTQDTGLNPGTMYYYRAWSFTTWATNPSLSQWSDAYADAIGTTNHLPLISDPIPTPGSTNISLTPVMSITVTDPDNDLMSIRWYSNSSGAWQQFGTNTSVPNSTYHQLNTNFSAYTTTYWWNVTVTDQMDTTTSSLYSFTTQGEPQQNTSPLPPQISGPLAAGPNITLNFTTITTDPDQDDVYYLWDWGDNTTTDWLGPYCSGQPMRTNHSWNHTGEYDIRVKAKDTTGMESNWSEPHHITIAPQLWIRNIQPGFVYIIFLDFNKSFLYSYFLETLGVSVVITKNELVVEVDATDYVDMVTFEALNLMNEETYYGQDTNGSGFFSYSFNITRGIYQLTVKAYDASGNHIDTTGIPLVVYLRFGKYATSRSLHHPLRSARLVH